MKDQHSITDDELDLADDAAYAGEGPHLINGDELRAAGALDVPPAWRKSLGGGDKGLFDEVVDDDEAAAPNERNQHPVDTEPDELAG